MLCPDGVIRAPSRIAHTADTFFSVPCGMRIKGKYVTGYATSESNITDNADNVTVHTFRPHTCEVEAGKCSEWPRMFTPEWDALMAKGL